MKAEVKLICSRSGTANQNRKSRINMFMAGNCRSKKKERNLRLLAGDNSLPRSHSGRGHAMLPAPMRLKLSYILFPLFCALVCSDQ